jgi:hypothetical protein
MRQARLLSRASQSAAAAGVRCINSGILQTTSIVAKTFPLAKTLLVLFLF